MDVMKTEREFLLEMNGASLVLGKCRALPVAIQGLVAEISSVFVEPKSRGKGKGNAIIQKVCDDFDDVGGALILQADSERLEKWYSKFGFLKFQDDPILMVRLPRAVQKVVN